MHFKLLYFGYNNHRSLYINGLNSYFNSRINFAKLSILTPCVNNLHLFCTVMCSTCSCGTCSNICQDDPDNSDALRNIVPCHRKLFSWWRHQMETFSALQAICAGNSQVPGEFPTQRPVTRSFDVFLDLRLNKRLSKQSRGWWFETLPHPLWRHTNGLLV